MDMCIYGRRSQRYPFAFQKIASNKTVCKCHADSKQLVSLLNFKKTHLQNGFDLVVYYC